MTRHVNPGLIDFSKVEQLKGETPAGTLHRVLREELSLKPVGLILNNLHVLRKDTSSIGTVADMEITTNCLAASDPIGTVIQAIETAVFGDRFFTTLRLNGLSRLHNPHLTEVDAGLLVDKAPYPTYEGGDIAQQEGLVARKTPLPPNGLLSIDPKDIRLGSTGLGVDCVLGGERKAIVDFSQYGSTEKRHPADIVAEALGQELLSNPTTVQLLNVDTLWGKDPDRTNSKTVTIEFDKSMWEKYHPKIEVMNDVIQFLRMARNIVLVGLPADGLKGRESQDVKR